MNRIFQTKTFSRWMSKNDIDDTSLIVAVQEMESGLIDAELGGSICKKRISRPGQGKRGGGRTIVATKHHEKWFFLYGFNKNERSNIKSKELKALQDLAEDLLMLPEEKLLIAIKKGTIKEVSQ